ncbi:MAG: cytidylate kinase family protein [Thermodesulfobacteriota bacterium]|nr:cytidylate kinase family protein [Thermodesulfobacteriota bacterium]
MSIIIISSDIAETEAMIAGAIAEEKGYALLDRRVLHAAANRYGVKPERLNDALERRPSLLRRLPPRQWRYYLACIEAEVLDRLLADNIICRDVGAHLYVNGVSHAMKIRVLAGKQACREAAEREGGSLEKAEKQRSRINRRRTAWSMAAYQKDEADPAGYDLVVSLDQIDPVEAVRTIVGASAYRKFQSMTYSTKCLTDLALAAQVRAALLKSMSDMQVQARDGSVVVTTRALNRRKRETVEAIKQLAGQIPGVGYVEVHVRNHIFGKVG